MPLKNRFIPVTLASAGLACVLTACGGGGGGTGDLKDAFAPAAGTLCTTQDTAGACSEPTSSSITVQDLQTRLSDPNGPLVRFTTHGVILDVSSTVYNGAYTQGRLAYSFQKKEFTVGHNAISVDGKTYAFDKHLAQQGVDQYLYQDQPLQLGANQAPGAMRVSQQYDGTKSLTGAIGNQTLALSEKQWIGYLHLLTDQVQAPAEDTVTYNGSVAITAGDGHVLGVGNALAVLGGGCQITLTLDTRTGVLHTTDASCTDALSGAAVNWHLADLRFKGSKVSQAMGNEAHYDISGPASGSPQLPTISVAQQTSTQLAGAIYGDNAAYIEIAGVSSNGIFQITAVRQ